VRCELEPAERAIDRTGDRLGEHRLAHARHVLDQQMPLGDERHQCEPDLLVLATNDALDVLLDLMEARSEPLPFLATLSNLHDHLRAGTAPILRPAPLRN